MIRFLCPLRKIANGMAILLVMCCTLHLSVPVAAMDFTQSTWRGKEVVAASGPIVEGDTDRLLRALEILWPAPHGARIVLLDSPGGSVAEALRMSAAVAPFDVHTVIPEGARCASACASILFVAGGYRTIESGGLFGQHSCAVNGAPDASCNETIAQHAILHGVSHGSIAAFVTYVPPQEILWFSRRDVDCWGISYYPFSVDSSFEKSEPCFWTSVGRVAPIQSAWRVDFLEDGYRAFARPVNDHEREFELSFFCDENNPGRLFLSLDLSGPSEAISSALRSARIEAPPVASFEAPFKVVQADMGYSRIIVESPPEQTRNLLLRANSLGVAFGLAEPYDPMHASSSTEGSKAALLFAANNCIGS